MKNIELHVSLFHSKYTQMLLRKLKIAEENFSKVTQDSDHTGLGTTLYPKTTLSLQLFLNADSQTSPDLQQQCRCRLVP